MGAELVDFETHIIEELQDPEFLEEYLNEALQEEDPKTFLTALKYIAKSRKGGIAQLAKDSGFSRGALYKTLSANGNPTFKSLNNFLNIAGFQLKVKAIKPAKKNKRISKKELTPA